jgi:hypothetical protein
MTAAVALATWEEVLDVFLRDAGNPHGSFPALASRTGADFPNPLHGFVRTGAVKEMFQLITEGIPDGDAEEG